MTSASHSHPAPSRSWWHQLLSDSIRWVLAPLVLLFSGFFTANFIISGLYTWPRTSRVLALTLTVLILSYEFVYKEQLARGLAPERARRVLFYACVAPYLVGWALMVVLWMF